MKPHHFLILLTASVLAFTSCTSSSTATSPTLIELYPAGTPKHSKILTPTGGQDSYFYPSGSLEISFPLDPSGQIHGTLRAFYPGGTPAEVSHWDHGKCLDGQSYNPDGSLNSQIIDGTGTRLLLYQGQPAGFEEFRNGINIGGAG